MFCFPVGPQVLVASDFTGMLFSNPKGPYQSYMSALKKKKKKKKVRKDTKYIGTG